jgi:hypothetical protein
VYLDNTSVRSMSRTTLFATITTILLLPLLTGCGTAQAKPTDSSTSQGPAGPPGIVYRKAYDATVQYSADDAVTYQRSTYIALQATINIPPMGSPSECGKVVFTCWRWRQWTSWTARCPGCARSTRCARPNRPDRVPRASRHSWSGSNLLLGREKVFCAGG